MTVPSSLQTLPRVCPHAVHSRCWFQGICMGAVWWMVAVCMRGGASADGCGIVGGRRALGEGVGWFLIWQGCKEVVHLVHVKV